MNNFTSPMENPENQDHIEEILNAFLDLRHTLMEQTRDRLIQKAQQNDLTNLHNVALFQNALVDLQTIHYQMEANLRTKLALPDTDADPAQTQEGQTSVMEESAASTDQSNPELGDYHEQ